MRDNGCEATGDRLVCWPLPPNVVHAAAAWTGMDAATESATESAAATVLEQRGRKFDAMVTMAMILARHEKAAAREFIAAAAVAWRTLVG